MASRWAVAERWAGCALVLVFGGWLYLAGLGQRHILSSNEANRIEATREMRLTGDFVIPHINGRIYLTKPPLYYWLSAALWRDVERFDEFVARLPSVLSGLACLVVVYGFARRWFGRRVARASVAILATAPLFFLQAWEAELDMLLCLLTTLSVCVLVEALEAKRGGLALFGLSFLVLGGAAMTKGPVPLVVFGLTLAGYVVCRRPPLRSWLPGVLAGLVVLVAVVAPWCVAVVGRIGWDEAWGTFVQESARRVARASRINRGPWHFYVSRLVATFFPWSLWLPAAGMVGWRLARRWREGAGARTVLFLAAWFVPAFVFFSACAGKEAQYILPLYPPLAILCGLLAVRWANGELRRGERVAFGMGTWLAAGILGVVGLGGPVFVTREMPGGFAAAAALGAVVALAGVVGVLCWRRRALGGVLAAFVAAFAASKAIYAWELLPVENARRSPRAFCRRVAEVVPRSAPLLMYGRERSYFSLYTGRVVREAEKAEVLAALASGEPAYVLMREDAYRELVAEHRKVGYIRLASHGGHLVLLVANRAATPRGSGPLRRRSKRG